MTECQIQMHQCQLSDGRQFSWRECGSGTPLIMLHGWSMSSAVFSEVAVQMAEKFRVLCPDLPGHGESDPVANNCLDTYSATIENWAGRLGLSTAVLLGWSLGGQVAMQLVLRKKLWFSQLVLVATTPFFCQEKDWSHGLPRTQIRALERNLGRNYTKTLGDYFQLQFSGEDLDQKRFQEIVKFAVRTAKLPEPKVAKEALQLLANVDQRKKLFAIDLPVLVMHGDLDQIIPYSAGCNLAAQIPCAQWILLSGVGHAPFFSRPEESVSRWFEFLQ